MGIRKSMTGVSWHIESNYSVDHARKACSNCEFYQEHVCTKHGISIQCNNAPICTSYHNIYTDERYERPVQKVVKTHKQKRKTTTAKKKDVYRSEYQSQYILKYYCKNEEEFIKFRKYRTRTIDFELSSTPYEKIDQSKLLFAKIIYKDECVRFKILNEKSKCDQKGIVHIQLGQLWENPGIVLHLEDLEPNASGPVRIKIIANVTKKEAKKTKVKASSSSKSNAKKSKQKNKTKSRNSKKKKSK